MVDLINSYLNGLFNLASSISKNIDSSYIKVDVYEKETFIQEFSENYNLDEKYTNIVPTKRNFKEVLIDFVKEKNLAEKLLYWIELEIGESVKVLASDNVDILEALSCKNGGFSSFYTVEDIYFIEFEDYIVALMKGNNE